MRWFYIIGFLCLCNVALSQVVINEYSCSNVSTTLDFYGEREDWVELYNPGASPQNLSGFWLSDDKLDPQKWQIPAGVTIAATGRLMVYCSDRGVVTGGQLHPSFKLTQTNGEYFVISDPGGTIVDSVQLVPMQADHSRGRTTDGSSSWSLFSNPTPNTANANPRTGYATRPVMSIPAGNYPAAQMVTLSSPDPNVTIHYTLDGSTPTNASATYSAPIPVNATTVIRAKAYSSDPLILPSFTETNTYFINEVTTVNIISVCGAYNATLGNVGATNDFQTSIEYFDKNKQLKFEMEGIMRRHGNDSWAFPQKGLRFHARDQLGYDHSMSHKIFSTSSRDEFNVMILKAAGSDNFDGGPSPAAHMRDAFCQSLAIKYDLEMDARNYEPAILFVNGQYWGLYEVRERVDEDYAEYYYGQSKNKVDILRYWGGLNVEAGSDTGWVNLYNFIMANNMAVQANYEHVRNFLNVESFIQYFIINTWLVNTDWLNWNTMWWRGRSGQGVKWRYALWDQDNILALGQNYTGMGTVTFQNDPCQPFSLFQNNSTIKHTDMLARLMNNAEFDQFYRDVFIEMLNGPLNCDNMLPHFDSIYNLILPEMQRQCTRWGANFVDWQTNVQFARDQIVNRCAVIAQKLDTCMNLYPQKLSVNVDPPGGGTVMMGSQTLSPYVWSKIMAADTTLQLTAVPAGPYWLFDHWEHYEASNSFQPDSLTAAADFKFNKKDSVVAFFRYYNPDSLYVTFDVTPPGMGTLELDNTPIPGYPYTVKLDRRYTYSLKAQPAPYWDFITWTRLRTSSSFSPSATERNISFQFQESDTVVAHFETDTVDVTFIVNPAGAGSIRLENTILASYPATLKLNRRYAYSLLGLSAVGEGFVSWENRNLTGFFSPSTSDPGVSYSFGGPDTVIANFANLPPQPPAPELNRNFSLPTAFTPNGDGLNDRLVLIGGQHVKSIDLKIYDRWGSLIFTTTDPKMGWDGTFNGHPVEMGTYFYQLQVWFDNGYYREHQAYKGEVTLIR